jgi:hypothetical protein
MLTDNATTLPETQYEDLADLLESHPSSEDHQIDNATGRVQKNNKYGNPTGRQYSNVGEYIDVLLHKDAQKVANIINNFEDLSQAPATPYIATATNIGDFVNQISTNAVRLKLCVDNFLWLIPPATVTRCNIHPTDKTLIEYEHNGATETVNVLELTEQLFLMQKISIANLNMVVQKLDRAQKRRERQANRSTNLVAPWAPAGSSGILQETHEDLNVPQIQAALNFAKTNKKTGSAYSYDNKWFPVRYERDATGVETYSACIQDERGNVTEIDAPNTSTLIRNIMNTTKKAKEQVVSPEIVDMENEFSQSKFMDLCEQVSKSKNKRGEYKLGGKSYIVREVTPAQPARWLRTLRPATYNSQYLGHVNRTAEHTGNAQDLSQYLKQNIHFHADTEGHHTFSKKWFQDLCEHVLHEPDKKWEYELDGHKHPLWIKEGSIKNTYYAEIPGEGGRTHEISAWSPEKLYEKILKKAHRLHTDKTAEWQETKKEGEEKHEKWWHDDAGHEGGGTLYDKTVVGLLGSGLIGKALLGTRNLVPKWIRNTTGWITKSGLAGVGGSAVITGGLYGASVLGLTTMGTATALTFFAPVALTIGGATAGYKFYRWWKWDGKKDGESAAHHS